jgi:hypothetical protein
MGAIADLFDTSQSFLQCRHLLRMQQARLCRLQFTQRPLGSIPRPMDLLLGALALGDVTVSPGTR